MRKAYLESTESMSAREPIEPRQSIMDCDAVGVHVPRNQGGVMTKDEGKLEYMRQQFKRHELYALYWHARAMTGEAKTRKVYVGVALTDEEKAAGLPNERELTDDEKVKDALDKMRQHIRVMNELHDKMGEVLFK